MADEKSKRIIEKKFITTSGPASNRPPKIRNAGSIGETGDGKEDAEHQSGDTRQKKPMSIFAQRMAAKKREFREEVKHSEESLHFPKEMKSSSDTPKLDDIKNCLIQLGMVDNSQSISEDDILRLREQILKSTSPQNINYLVGRKSAVKTQEMATTSASVTTKPLGKIASTLPPEVEELKNFPNMNQVELNKLEWMKDSDSKGTVPALSSKPSEIQARFGLDGNILHEDINTDVTWWQGLHHHGEEMDRPGYTFEEYLYYARSSNPSQRAFAFNAMAAIFSKAHDGLYDDVLSINPLHLLGNVDVMTVVRTAMDFEDAVTVDAAIACLSSLLYSESEEECFDVTHLFPHPKPYLWLRKFDSENKLSACDPKLRDHQIISFDLISFLIERSRIIERLKYLMTYRTERLSKAAEINLLKILIRFARHSPDDLSIRIDFLRHISEHVMNPNWMTLCESASECKSSKKPQNENCNPSAISAWLALKLFRIICQTSYNNCRTVHTRLSVMSKAITYIVSSTAGIATPCSHGRLLVLECFRFWGSSIEKGFGVSEFGLIAKCAHSVFTALTAKITRYDGYFAAYLVNTINTILATDVTNILGFENFDDAWNFVKHYDTRILALTMHTLQSMSSGIEDWQLALVGQGIRFLHMAYTHGQMSTSRPAVEKCLKTSNLREIIRNTGSYSMLLRPTAKHDRYPSNIVMSNHIECPGQTVRILEPLSPFQLLLPVFEFVKMFDLVNELFISNIMGYIGAVAAHCPTTFISSYFYRFELRYLVEILTLLPPNAQVATLLIRVLCTIPRTDLVSFKKVIHKLSVIAAEKSYSSSVIVQLYFACYFPMLKSTGLTDELAVDGKSEIRDSPMLFMPASQKLVNGKFWFYDPLQRLCKRYSSKHQDLKVYYDQVVSETCTCLSVAKKLLTYPTVIESTQDLVTWYILVTQIFFMGDDLVCDNAVSNLLRDTFVLMVQRWYDIKPVGKQFSEFKPGDDVAFLSSFEEYFRDLVKEFESSSFGNDIFATYLMFPLRPSESIELKLIFWSSPSVRFVRIPEPNDLLSVDHFISEPEVDAAVLQQQTNLLYHKNSCVSKMGNPFIFEILHRTISAAKIE